MPQRSVSAQDLDYYRTHIREAIREDGVVCLECGRLCRAMGNHVRTHGLSLNDYREKWGYNQGRAFVAPDLRQRLRELALARGFGKDTPPDLWRRAQEVLRHSPPRHRREARLNQAEAARARHAAGWRPTNKRVKVSEETLRALVAEGLTLAQIAARTGLSYGHAARRVRELGLVHPGIVRRRLRTTDAELVALREAGLWTHQIAARTGMRPEAVQKRLDNLRRRGATVPIPQGPRPNARRRVNDDDLLALAREGLRAREIAGRVGLRKNSVKFRLQALRRRGLLPPAQPSALARERDAEAAGTAPDDTLTRNTGSC